MTSRTFACIATALLSLNFSSICVGAEQKIPVDNTTFAAEIARVNATHINKSPNDDRQYAAMLLGNHLQVVLVSDPTLETAAAALSLSPASAQNPETQLGLAHYLEHMLFLGTQKHPEPNGFSQFVQQNGGSDNAETYSDKTIYYFSINSASFEPALDWFSEYFKAPTFDPTYSDKERNAINNEWSNDKGQDSWNLWRIAELTINPQSPYSRFEVGNLETLVDKPDSKLQDELKHFFETYYSANLMHLTLVGKQSITELKQIAEKYFATIPNRDAPQPMVLVPAFTEAQYAKNIYYKPLQNIKQLIVEFPVRSNLKQWMFKPNDYLLDLISSQQPGTLGAQLRSQGYVTDMGGEYSTKEYGVDGYVRVQATLTDLGVKHQDQVTAAVFAYINLVKSQGLNEEYFEQMKAIASKQFLNYSKSNALDQAKDISIQQLDFPLEHLLDWRYTYQEYRPEVFQALFDQLDTRHVRVWHISPQEQVDKPVTYFDGKYAVHPITATEFAHLDQLAAHQHFKLPALNNLFSKDSAPIVENKFLRPHRVVAEPGVEAFVVQPEFYREDKGVISIELNSSQATQSVKNRVLQSMLKELFRKHNIALHDRANKAGLDVAIFNSPSLSIGMSVSGYTPKHAVLVSELVQSFATLDITQRDFEEARTELIDLISSTKSGTLIDQTNEKLLALLYQPHWDDETRIKAARHLSLKELRTYYTAVKKSLFVRLFAAGNYTEDQVRNMTHKVAHQLPSTISPEYRFMAKFKTPQSGHHWMYRDTVPLADDAVLLALFCDAKSYDEQAQLAVLSALLGGDLFNQLRTEEQLGYVVQNFPYVIDDVPGFVIRVQSSNSPTSKLVDRTKAFLGNYLTKLQNVNPQLIEQINQSLLSNELQKPTDFNVEMDQYSNEFWYAKYSFDHRDRYTAALKNVTKDNLLHLYPKLFLDPQAGSLLLQYKGTNFKNEVFVSGGESVH